MKFFPSLFQSSPSLYYLRYLTILLLVSSCKNNDFVLNENAVSFSEFPQESQATFEKVFDFNKGVAFNLHVVDSVLIVFNQQGGNGHFFYNYNLNSQQLSEGYLTGGRGPSQAVAAISSGIYGNTLWTYDISLKKVLTVDKTEAITKANDSVLSFKEYPVFGSYYTASLKDDDHFLGVGSLSSIYKIQEINTKTGEETDAFGVFGHVPNNMDFNAYKSAHQAFLSVKPTGDKAVLMYRFTDAIEIFDLNTKEGKAIHGPENYPVDFKPLNAGDFFVMERTSKTRFAFVAGAVTNQYIYAVYSGKFNESLHPNYGSFVFVYDWQGNPIKKITLDREMKSPAVSSDDQTLYAYDPNTGFVMKTHLN